ncbi:hypothetical protein BDW42DRAFT_117216 [Aspergillus taichungensis]|uniref:Uncharacterized protein n=1 Tax=Aspergillus taichungensis TaxID=482145 RepID=A0A2J5HRR7_9EURO|nr:hypothetical protein BDW42DRAFT_117216 [Aspergillus taichungensis]
MSRHKRSEWEAKAVCGNGSWIEVMSRWIPWYARWTIQTGTAASHESVRWFGRRGHMTFCFVALVIGCLLTM